MVVSDATWAQARRDKAPITEAPIPPKAMDASESSRADPGLVDQPSVRSEAYVTVDALKNFMLTMTDVIMQQVSEQVKKAMEVASSARQGCEPSRRRDPVPSPRRDERM